VGIGTNVLGLLLPLEIGTVIVKESETENGTVIEYVIGGATSSGVMIGKFSSPTFGVWN
jgi:hypothetical protein